MSQLATLALPEQTPQRDVNPIATHLSTSTGVHANTSVRVTFFLDRGVPDETPFRAGGDNSSSSATVACGFHFPALLAVNASVTRLMYLRRNTLRRYTV